MSRPAELGERAAAAAIHSLWRQWSIINPTVASEGAPDGTCVVDLEALVLATGAFLGEERRFADLLAWLATRASGLLSVQRMRTLMRAMPHAEPGAATFAHWALERGGDRRWKTVARSPGTSTPRTGKGPELPRVTGRAALMLRLRAAFGVGVKADLLTYMLCLDGEPRSAPDVADAIGYTDKTVRLALRDLHLAGLIEEFSDYPVTYATRPASARTFMHVLYGRKVDVPEWCPWSRVYGFLMQLSTWRQDSSITGSAYIASSHARDLFSTYEAPFRSHQLRMPRPEAYPGEAYLPVFEKFLARLETWLGLLQRSP